MSQVAKIVQRSRSVRLEERARAKTPDPKLRHTFLSTYLPVKRINKRRKTIGCENFQSMTVDSKTMKNKAKDTSSIPLYVLYSTSKIKISNSRFEKFITKVWKRSKCRRCQKIFRDENVLAKHNLTHLRLILEKLLPLNNVPEYEHLSVRYEENEKSGDTIKSHLEELNTYTIINPERFTAEETDPYTLEKVIYGSSRSHYEPFSADSSVSVGELSRSSDLSDPLRLEVDDKTDENDNSVIYLSDDDMATDLIVPDITDNEVSINNEPTAPVQIIFSKPDPPGITNNSYIINQSKAGDEYNKRVDERYEKAFMDFVSNVSQNNRLVLQHAEISLPALPPFKLPKRNLPKTKTIAEFNKVKLPAVNPFHINGNKQCPLCTCRQRDECRLKQHLFDYHKEDVLVECPHLNRCNNLTSCIYCGLVVKATRSFKSHALECHLSALNDFTCPICNRSINTRRNLLSHIKSHHPEEPMADISVRMQQQSCSICQEPFSSTCNLDVHVQNMFMFMVFKCDYCNTNFPDLMQLIEHQDNNHLSKCVCGRKFLTAEELNEHTQKCFVSLSIQNVKNRQVLSEQSYIDEPEHFIPISEFLNNANDKIVELSIPELTDDQSDEQIIEISDDEPIGQNRIIVKTQDVHSCVVCKKSFRNYNSLMKHLVMKHTNLMYCSQCEEEMFEMVEMAQHIAEEHTNNFTGFWCNICNPTVIVGNQSINLVRHLTNIHNVPYLVLSR